MSTVRSVRFVRCVCISRKQFELFVNERKYSILHVTCGHLTLDFKQSLDLRKGPLARRSPALLSIAEVFCVHVLQLL